MFARTALNYAALGVTATRACWDAGILRPVRPDRGARMIAAFYRYGPTLGAAGAVAAIRHPNRTAVIDERGALTYAELDARVAALTSALADLVADRRLGILCRNHRGFVEATLAGSRTGADLVFLNTDFSGPQLTEVAERENIGAIVTDAEFLPSLEGFAGPLVVAWHDGKGDHPTIDELAADPGELVAGPVHQLPRTEPGRLIILTSGTTGAPKGAMRKVSLVSAARPAIGLLSTVPLRGDDPMLVSPPLFHGYGLHYLAVALSLGAPLVLRRRFDPRDVLAMIERHRVGMYFGVPVMLQRILTANDDTDASRYDTSSLRVMASGAAALRPDLATALMDSFGDILYNQYGATESGWATIARPADLRAEPGTVGRPVPGLTVAILDTDGRPVAEAQVGEVFIGGGMPFDGYTGGGGRQLRDGLMSTGDLGHLDADGLLFIDGRADDMIVSGGENVFPEEVENLLARHDDVADVAVSGVADDEFGQRLVAHVVRVTGTEVSAEDLKAYVKSHLARYKVPREVQFVAELPRTATGKVRRIDLASDSDGRGDREAGLGGASGEPSVVGDEGP